MVATLQLIKIATEIYLINLNEFLQGDKIMMDKIAKSDKVEVLNKTKTTMIHGDSFVNKISVEQEGNQRDLDVQGIFIEIGTVPVTAPACHIANTNKWGEIIVNERCETNVPGLFAAGDVTNVPQKQIIVAAGHGCIALLSAFEYISRKH